MARPLRIEIPGGLFHVTSRGDRREPIYLRDADRRQWLTLLGQVCDRFNWRCHAYCLMDNHFHIVVHTIDGNLSAGMRQLNGVYTQWHNRAHNRVGHVFQGRFKAIIVQRETYLLELARYVVLNPVRAKMCALPEEWPWSSYLATTGAAPRPDWLDSRWLLAQFGMNEATALPAYINHVRAGIGHPPVWDALKHQTYLGDEDFAQALQLKAQDKTTQAEIPRAQRRAGAPPLEQFHAIPDRQSAMAQAYRTGCYSLKEIAKSFGVHYATVSRAVKALERDGEGKA
jgi:putative transposase